MNYRTPSTHWRNALPQMTSRNDASCCCSARRDYRELGYSAQLGSRTYAFSGFHEQVWNGQINLSGDMSTREPAGNLLFDGMSKTSSYNIGNYARNWFCRFRRTAYYTTTYGFWFGHSAAWGDFSTSDPSHVFDGHNTQPSFANGDCTMWRGLTSAHPFRVSGT